MRGMEPGEAECQGGAASKHVMSETSCNATLAEGVELCRAVEKSGKIYRSTKEAGDVQVGVAGQGQFKDVKV